ncbi:MAG: sialate O-acetylesterase [Fuerstiella sp.]|nr:sialate O-acetylesterase [Fuerstiella sp.]
MIVLSRVAVFTLLALTMVHSVAHAAAKPLKVYILAGQSNMEGHARVEVLDYLGDDPQTAPLLDEIKNTDGSHRLIRDTWISFQTGLRGRIDGENREVFGQLTTGYGSQGNRDYEQPGRKIGPELAFGITLQKQLNEPILIIKTAWGGQSLHTNFRSPSSGPYVPSKDDIARGKFQTEEQKEKLRKATGARYRQMIGHVKFVLQDIKRVYPDYDSADGYELSGFVWFQGFNDMVGRNVYPLVKPEIDVPRFAKYTKWFASFIRDTRHDLSAPDMPFVIGVMGVIGADANEGNLAFRSSQAAVADIPEFKGNVVAVPTAPYWDERLAVIDKKRGQMRQKGHQLRTKNPKHENVDGTMTPNDIKQFLVSYEQEIFTTEELALDKRGKSNAGYHYLGSAKTFCQIGQAFAEALLTLHRDAAGK